MRETAIAFGKTESLVGIVSDPARFSNLRLTPAVILLNSGIVHRTGPGRVYVKLARALTAAGFTTLRFDFSGIGDSPIRHDTLPFEKSAVEETQQAMDFLRATRGIDRFILLGGCSGAYLSMETACADMRVMGAILINFPLSLDSRTELEQNTALHHYYNFALLSGESWRKLLTGKSDYRKIMRALRFVLTRRLASEYQSLPEATELVTNLRLLIGRGVRVAFVCSEGDSRLDDLRAAGGDGLRSMCSRGEVGLEVIPGSDHTFTSLNDHQRLLRVVRERISAMCHVAAPDGEMVGRGFTAN